MALRAPAKTPRRAEASRPQLEVVKGRGKGTSKGRTRWSPIPVVVCVVLATFGVSALQATMSQDGLKAAKLEKDVQQEAERATLLRARLAQLSNPGRIAREAEELGLVGAPAPKHIKVRTDEPEKLSPNKAAKPVGVLRSGRPATPARGAP